MSPQHQGLKVKFGLLLRAVGGVEAAATFCRVGKSVLAAAGSLNEAERFPPADAILDLETVTRGTPEWPVVTRYLARQQGFELVALPPAEGAEGMDWLAHISRVSKEAGDVVSKIAAHAAGGLSPDEIKRADLLRECRELVAAAVNIEAAVLAAQRG